ncbi:phospholipase D-like domain-containing protein, partial [Clostridium sp.]|uniref:phospholipase D-like domain-containing protein n=1 Tax=Clostridium sp. TaxID=1506 RepID=UPI00261828F9
MIEIINENLNDRFFNLVSDSKQTIKLCSPFVKEDIIKEIYNNKKTNVSIDIISNFSIPNFYKGSSDIEAFNLVEKNKDRIFNCQKLHAKIYIFDNNKSIITSSNLTYSGLNKNLEYGVFINDLNLVNKTIVDFIEICNDKNNSIIKENNILEIEKILRSLPKYKENKIFNNTGNEVDYLLEENLDLIKSNLSQWK